MKRYLFYYINRQGGIMVYYSHGDHYIRLTYLGYTLREAIQKFRRDYNLQHKHIIIEGLNKTEKKKDT